MKDRIESNLNRTKNEYFNWCGIDYDTGDGIPYDTWHSNRHGLNTAITQTTRIERSLKQIEDELDTAKYKMEELQYHISKLASREVRFVFYRIIKEMSLKQIAKKLNLSYGYTRTLWPEIRELKEVKHILEKAGFIQEEEPVLNK